MPSGIITPYEVPATTKPPRGPGLALKLRVWHRQLNLDRELASGVDPNYRDDLSLRAAQLAQPRRRELQAKGLDRLVDIADRRRAPIATPHAPLRPLQIRANRALLIDLADRLRDGKPAAVRGLAMTSLMLEDGRGPLTTSVDPRVLGRAVRAARAALDA
jgi:hypothetical protein